MCADAVPRAKDRGAKFREEISRRSCKERHERICLVEHAGTTPPLLKRDGLGLRLQDHIFTADRGRGVPAWGGRPDTRQSFLTNHSYSCGSSMYCYSARQPVCRSVPFSSLPFCMHYVCRNMQADCLWHHSTRSSPKRSCLLL
jgi:hypothetical protein